MSQRDFTYVNIYLRPIKVKQAGLLLGQIGRPKGDSSKGDVGKERTAFATTCRIARLCDGSADVDWCNRNSATRLQSAQFVTCSQIRHKCVKNL